ncbi:MAG: HlyC/CorC family transporter [Phycisphaeraceae bacterium]|nr:MAG: HlyC/CorC family transporter [Phycisphaeraceae bacterium]
MTGLALWIALAAAIVGGLLSTLHMSLREMSRGKLQAIAARKGGAERLAPILDDVGAHALAISLPRVVCNLVVVVGMLVWFTGFGDEARVTWVGLLGSGAVAALLLYLVGVVIPTSVADHAGEDVVHRCAGLIRALYYMTLPLARAVRLVDVIIKRLAGVNDHDIEDEIEREIMNVVSEGEHEGSIGEAERQMIEAVVDLRTATAQEIMTPRTEIEGIELTDDLDYIKSFIDKAGHSRIPVYKGDLDHIVGVLYAKDLLKYLGAEVSNFKLRPILRKPQFVPETKPLLGLLAHFQGDKIHLAIVLDEYGGTAGLVTIEDLLEEIVGEIADEYEPLDEAAPKITVIVDERAVEMDARAYIDDVNDRIEEELGVELPEGEEYDTVGGFVMTELGHMPVAGESFARNGFVVRVLEAEPTRVAKVRVEFRESSEEEEHAAAGNGNGNGR